MSAAGEFGLERWRSLAWHERIDLGDYPLICLIKVSGGWLYCSSHGQCYVPVGGADPWPYGDDDDGDEEGGHG
jgi:hypothetical protein